MQIPERLKYDVEAAFMKTIIRGLRLSEYTPAAAKELARQFLPVIYAQSLEEFRLQLEHFCGKTAGFKELLVILKRYDAEKETHTILEKMRQHMRSGNLEGAISVAEQAIQQ